MRHGAGSTRWPSGAVYDGEYSAGFKDGQGTYVVTNPSSSYKGQWKLDRKHGVGLQAYANGDVYHGSWVQGQMEGHGSYTWANGNSYVGAMRNGLMSGKGIFTWRSTAAGGGGDSLQGNWLDGMAHGYGLYTWEGGGCYLGTWTRGLKDGKGTFTHTSVPAAIVDDLRKRGVLPEISVGGTAAGPEPPAAVLSRRNSGLGRPPMKKKPSLQRRRSIGVAGGPDKTLKCEDSSSSPVLEREYAQGVLISEIVLEKWSLPESPSRKLKLGPRRAAKRPGETIIKGHRSYDLMLCLQLGIR
jgi:1-phosphatidylinositol-4-phosphate 5-kinase